MTDVLPVINGGHLHPVSIPLFMQPVSETVQPTTKQSTGPILVIILHSTILFGVPSFLVMNKVSRPAVSIISRIPGSLGEACFSQTLQSGAVSVPSSSWALPYAVLTILGSLGAIGSLAYLLWLYRTRLKIRFQEERRRNGVLIAIVFELVKRGLRPLYLGGMVLEHQRAVIYLWAA